jgi:alkylation response protein AidB-like acyl-CoA dehydrogenase
VTTGAALVVPALQEDAYATTAEAAHASCGQDGALSLTGRKMFVAPTAPTAFLVSAGGREETRVVLCGAQRAGCTLSTTQTVEGRKLATLSLADTPADLIPPGPSSRNAVDALHGLALMALSSELLGVMEKALEVTLDYLRIRKQFGKLIGSFQALQHQAVNIYIRTEATRSLVFQIAANNDLLHRSRDGRRRESQAPEDAIVVTGLHPVSRRDRVHRRE